MSRLIGLALVLVGVAYPFAVHYGHGVVAPWEFAMLLAGLWLARALTGERRPDTLLMAGAALCFCILLGGFNSPRLLRWYPVLINAFLLVLFGASLLRGMPMAERLARLREPELPERAVRYTRRVTQVWCLFFLLNGLTAAALTLWAPLDWWTLYTGVIAYLLMGALFAVEWRVRQRVRAQA